MKSKEHLVQEELLARGKERAAQQSTAACLAKRDRTHDAFIRAREDYYRAATHEREMRFARVAITRMVKKAKV